MNIKYHEPTHTLTITGTRREINTLTLELGTDPRPYMPGEPIPHNPQTLTTHADYEQAPNGTIIRGADYIKNTNIQIVCEKHSGTWYATGETDPLTNADLAGTTRTTIYTPPTP